jgi:putative heme iron utilization protein
MGEQVHTDPIEVAAPRVMGHMNGDHRDAVVMYAKAFGGISDVADAEMTSLDEKGFVLKASTPSGEQEYRHTFESAIGTADEARQELVRLVGVAREKLSS